MSAIAGLIRLDGGTPEAATLQRMLNVLAPYGRDARQIWQQGPAGLLRTLLRTTPHDSLDRQPLHDEASDHCLVFDGRLDNREELRLALGLARAETELMADSQLALHAIGRWDCDAVSRFVGDFAIACWSPRSRRLWLARDPLGHRSLLWHRQAGFFAFATLPKALFAIEGVPRTLNEGRLFDVLALLPWTGPESFFQDVNRVEPGQLLLFDGTRITTRRFHDFDAEREITLPRDEDYVDALHEVLEQVMSSHLRSCGGIASHLSSGLDSSTVSALAARQLAARGQRLTCYTAVPRPGFDGPVPRGRHADEGPAARAVVQRFDNIDHVLIPSRPLQLDQIHASVEDLDHATLNPLHMDWLNAINVDAGQRGARVVLSGAMGNMSISYTGDPYLPALLGRGQLSRWWREARALRGSTSVRWRTLLGQSLLPHLPAPLWRALSRTRNQRLQLDQYSAVNPHFASRVNAAERIRQSGWNTSHQPWANGRHMRVAVVKRISEGHFGAAAKLEGVELRDPTSDLRLLEFCLAVPDHQYLREGQKSWLLRRLMADILPPEILQTRSKGMQCADWFDTMATALPQLHAEMERMASHTLTSDYLDLQRLQADLENWPDAGTASQANLSRYQVRLLRALGAAAFIRHAAPDNR